MSCPLRVTRLHPLLGDSMRLKQILLNYLTNAIKFTSQGEIVLVLECLGVSARGVSLRFVVEDMGGGVSQADDKASTTLYDLILMDLQMPEMNGLDATRLIRDLPDYRAIPIIAMTARLVLQSA